MTQDFRRAALNRIWRATEIAPQSYDGSSARSPATTTPFS